VFVYAFVNRYLHGICSSHSSVEVESQIKKMCVLQYTRILRVFLLRILLLSG
jgi:hypothetical protein